MESGKKNKERRKEGEKEGKKKGKKGERKERTKKQSHRIAELRNSREFMQRDPEKGTQKFLVPLILNLLVRVSIVVMKHHDHKMLGVKEFVSSFNFQFHTPLQREVRVGTQGRNHEAGADTEALLTGLLSCLSHPAFFYHL